MEARPNVPLLPQAAVGSPPLWGWNSDPSRHKPLTRDAAPGEWRQKRQRSSHRRLLKGRQRPPHWPNSTPRRRKHAGPVWVADHQPAVLGSPRQTSGSSPSAPRRIKKDSSLDSHGSHRIPVLTASALHPLTLLLAGRKGFFLRVSWSGLSTRHLVGTLTLLPTGSCSA